MVFRLVETTSSGHMHQSKPDETNSVVDCWPVGACMVKFYPHANAF